MSSNLIKINHLVIKKKHAKKAIGLFKKLVRIDDSIQCFDIIDQRLFKNWSQLLLQPLENKTEALSKELDSLNNKHEHICAISELNKINYITAYKIYQDEDLVLASGPIDQKHVILKRREDRENYIKIKKQSINSEDLSQKTHEEESATLSSASDLCDLYLNGMAQTEKMFSLYFSDVAHLKAEQIEWNNHFQATRFLSVLIERARVSGIENDWKAYFSAITLASLEVRKLFKMYLLKKYNIESDLDILSMQERSYAFRKEVLTSQRNSGLSAEDNEHIKLIYRKLARLLHPDKIQSNHYNIDLSPLWQQTQEAYLQKDKKQLELLEKYVFLLIGNLDHLNTSDLNTISGFLQQQLFYKRLKNKELRKDLAWGFSRKRSLDTLEKKLKAPYLEEIKILEHEIQRLKRTFTKCDATCIQLELPIQL